MKPQTLKELSTTSIRISKSSKDLKMSKTVSPDEDSICYRNTKERKKQTNGNGDSKNWPYPAAKKF